MSSKKFYAFKDFSIRPIQRSYQKNALLIMQVYRFEFDTGCSNDYRIQLLNNKFITGILGGGGGGSLTLLDQNLSLHSQYVLIWIIE